MIRANVEVVVPLGNVFSFHPFGSVIAASLSQALNESTRYWLPICRALDDGVTWAAPTNPSQPANPNHCFKSWPWEEWIDTHS